MPLSSGERKMAELAGLISNLTLSQWIEVAVLLWLVGRVKPIAISVKFSLIDIEKLTETIFGPDDRRVWRNAVATVGLVVVGLIFISDHFWPKSSSRPTSLGYADTAGDSLGYADTAGDNGGYVDTRGTGKRSDTTWDTGKRNDASWDSGSYNISRCDSGSYDVARRASNRRSTYDYGSDSGALAYDYGSGTRSFRQSSAT
jgi:hypothetical protein